MGRVVLLTIAVLALLVSSCGQSSECGEDSGRATVDVNAAALAQPGSRLVVCVDDFCNADDDTDAFVSVGYSGVHPSVVSFGVTRVTNGSSFEALVGGEVDLPCGPDPVSVQVMVGADGEVVTTRTP